MLIGASLNILVLGLIGGAGRTVVVCHVHKVAKNGAQGDLLTIEVNDHAVKQILNTQNHNICIGIQFINLFHNDVEVMDIAQNTVGKNVGQRVGHVTFANVVLDVIADDCLCFVGSLELSFGLENVAEVRCPLILTIGHKVDQLVADINTEVVPADINGDQIGIGNAVLVGSAQCFQTARLCAKEPAVRTGKSPGAVVVTHVGVVQQNPELFHTHGADCQLIDLYIIVFFGIVVTNQVRICALRLSLVAIDVHVILADLAAQQQCQFFFRDVASHTITVGIGSTDRYIIERVILGSQRGHGHDTQNHAQSQQKGYAGL